MPLRNGEHGYGAVTKALHWLTVLALLAQVVVGYAIERADDLLEGPVDRWLGGEEEGLVVVHAVLGVVILGIAVVRTVWRRTTPLPPWAPTLSAVERRLAGAVERVLYVLLFAIPLTGLALLLGSGEEWDLPGGTEWAPGVELVDDDVLLVLHVITHLTLYAAVAVHVGLVLKHQLVDRDGLLRRML